jgi:ABC-type sugar transport system substrate-binding protein
VRIKLVFVFIAFTPHGNGFFEAANVGAQQAAKELGDVKVIYTGPTTTTDFPAISPRGRF